MVCHCVRVAKFNLPLKGNLYGQNAKTNRVPLLTMIRHKSALMHMRAQTEDEGEK